MGLDTTHDCWHGAYSAFGRWRNCLTEIAGYRMVEAKYGRVPDLNWDRITEANIEGHWEEEPEDPLIVLIAHADCDGVIHPQHAGPLADRLEGLLPKLPTEIDGGHIGDWRATTQQFIDGLRCAAARGEDVEFH